MLKLKPEDVAPFANPGREDGEGEVAGFFCCEEDLLFLSNGLLLGVRSRAVAFVLFLLRGGNEALWNASFDDDARGSTLFSPLSTSGSPLKELFVLVTDVRICEYSVR